MEIHLTALREINNLYVETYFVTTLLAKSEKTYFANSFLRFFFILFQFCLIYFVRHSL